MSWRAWLAIIIAGWVSMVLASSLRGNPDDWFFVSGLHVNDVVAGQEPQVEYTRVIRKEFRGTWLGEINEVTDDGLKLPCGGNGMNNYKPGDVKSNAVPLSDFIGKKCTLEAGKSYQVEAVWTLRPIDLPPMEISRSSNVFRVLPKPPS